MITKLYSSKSLVLVTLFFINVCLTGCETIKGAARDIGNTAGNVREVLRLGRDIHDISK